uniref:Uncharacterized protein n=1 Tax=Meloidogyne incognita TaxID=6306 RepID=A0A914L2S4_MELIC
MQPKRIQWPPKHQTTYRPELKEKNFLLGNKRENGDETNGPAIVVQMVLLSVAHVKKNHPSILDILYIVSYVINHLTTSTSKFNCIHSSCRFC